MNSPLRQLGAGDILPIICHNLPLHIITAAPDIAALCKNKGKTKSSRDRYNFVVG